MDIDKLKELIDIMNSNNLTELEIEENGEKVRLQKGQPPVTVPVVSHASAPEAAAAEPQPQAEGGTSGETIDAPMVGTFYKAPSPDEPPYASVGDKVTPDTVICIIEAMKVMNEIKAGVEGEIVEILVENGAPVEYGNPLFRIKTA